MSAISRILNGLKSLQTQEFADGYTVGPINRDEFKIRTSEGRIICAYAFVAGPDEVFERIVVVESLSRYSDLDRAIVPDKVQEQALARLFEFRDFNSNRIGVQIAGEVKPISLKLFLSLPRRPSA